MPRRREIAKREIPSDALYGSPLVTKFINTIMQEGKRSTAERILYQSFDIIKERSGDDPLKIFKKALDNVKPALEVKSRRVGGSNYQVPIAWRRQDDAGEAGERTARRGQFARWCGQEARRHASHGGSQQSVCALPVVETLSALGSQRSAGGRTLRADS
jgi:hypothetical protein